MCWVHQVQTRQSIGIHWHYLANDTDCFIASLRPSLTTLSLWANLKVSASFLPRLTTCDIILDAIPSPACLCLLSDTMDWSCHRFSQWQSTKYDGYRKLSSIPSKSSLLDILPCTVLKSCTHVQLGGLGSTVSNPNRVHGPIPSLWLEYWPLWRNGTHPLWDLQGYDSGLQWLQQVWVVCEACRLSIEIRVSADHLNPSCRCSSISYQTYLTSMCRFTASLL